MQTLIGTTKNGTKVYAWEPTAPQTTDHKQPTDQQPTMSAEEAAQIIYRNLLDAAAGR